MKILQIIPNLIAGGAEVFLVNLCNALSELSNNEVTILTFQNVDEKHFLKNRLNKKIKLLTLHKPRGMSILLLFRLAKYLENHHYDVVHFHLNAISYSLISACKYKKHTHFFATIHNDAYKEANGIHRLLRKILFSFNLAHPITISEESKQSFYSLYNCESSLIWNGVPLSDISQDEQEEKNNNIVKFLYVASITPVKNAVALAKAANMLGRTGIALKVTFLGKPANYELVELLKKEESACVSYVGEVDNPIRYMAKSDYFVLPSFYEGLPISLLEAMSVGCIPIVTPVGGCKDIVKHNINGILISNQSVEAIRNALLYAINLDAFEAKRMRDTIASDIKSYSIGTCAQRHMVLYKQEINRGKSK